MGYICTRCGGTKVVCEAIVNPNTREIIDYFDESFEHATCGADKCPECGENGTLRWVDEEKQEMDAKDLDCLGYVRELRIDDYLSPTTLEEIAEEIKKKVNRG